MASRAGFLAVIALLAGAAGPPTALGHSGAPLEASSDLGGIDAILEFSKYGAKHILLGFDHLLFLGGLALLTTRLRDLAEIAALFAIAYSATLVGGALAGIKVPGDLIDGVIALSVGYVGVQIAFGREEGWPGRDPRGPALVFGLFHGLGLSSLLQDLQLPGDDLLPSAIGFNVGVEAGQIAALAVFVAGLALARAYPFPVRQRIPAGCALISASAALLAFLVLGVGL